MIIVAGALYVEADDRAGYLAGCAEVVERARATAGCLDFALSPDPLESGRINVFERWESDEAVNRFRGSGPEPGQTARILGAEVGRYRIAGVEPA